MYSFFYLQYIKWMSWLGGYRPARHSAKGIKHTSNATEAQSKVDKLATDDGNKYRGVGVLTGLLGIAIVFTAIAPVAFEISNIHLLRSFGVLKVTMMLTMLLLVYLVGHQSGLKQRWIKSRKESEFIRYENLRRSIENLRTNSTEDQAEILRVELIRILIGPTGQIHYNHSKSHQYEAIETTATRISWSGFIVALLCAILILLAEFHWLHHHAVLILGTAFLPALVGGIHGINGFLTIGNLANDHKIMAKKLRKISDKLESIDSSSIQEILGIAENTCNLLDGRDLEWMVKTEAGNNLSVA